MYSLTLCPSRLLVIMSRSVPVTNPQQKFAGTLRYLAIKYEKQIHPTGDLHQHSPISPASAHLTSITILITIPISSNLGKQSQQQISTPRSQSVSASPCPGVKPCHPKSCAVSVGVSDT